jgi:hypothetical protein
MSLTSYRAAPPRAIDKKENLSLSPCGACVCVWRIPPQIMPFRRLQRLPAGPERPSRLESALKRQRIHGYGSPSTCVVKAFAAFRYCLKSQTEAVPAFLCRRVMTPIRGPVCVPFDNPRTGCRGRLAPGQSLWPRSRVAQEGRRGGLGGMLAAGTAIAGVG